MRDGRLAGRQENLEVAYPRGDSMNKSEKEGEVVVKRNLFRKELGGGLYNLGLNCHPVRNMAPFLWVLGYCRGIQSRKVTTSACADGDQGKPNRGGAQKWEQGTVVGFP